MAALRVEAVRRLHQPHNAVLHDVLQRDAISRAARSFASDRQHEPIIALDQPLAGGVRAGELLAQLLGRAAHGLGPRQLGRFRPDRCELRAHVAPPPERLHLSRQGQLLLRSEERRARRLREYPAGRIAHRGHENGPVFRSAVLHSPLHLHR